MCSKCNKQDKYAKSKADIDDRPFKLTVDIMFHTNNINMRSCGLVTSQLDCGCSKQELSQDSVARLTCALPLNLLKCMTKDTDINVTQVGRDGTAIYQHAKFNLIHLYI